MLGIDPGSRLTGWGVVEEEGATFCHVASGTITLPPRGSLGERLGALHAEVGRLVASWVPAVVVLERAFVARNVHSALRLGEARGAVLAAVGATGEALFEYAPAEVKLTTVGYGRADKGAMMRGVAARLGLPPRQLRPDAADALALALCHLQRAPLLARVAGVLAAQGGSVARGGSAGREGSSRGRGAQRAGAERII